MKTLLAAILLLRATQPVCSTLLFQTVYNITCSRSTEFNYKVETKEPVWAFGAWYHTEGTGNGIVAGISSHVKWTDIENRVLEFHVEIRHNCRPGGSNIYEKIDPLTCNVRKLLDGYFVCTINHPSFELGNPWATC